MCTPSFMQRSFQSGTAVAWPDDRAYCSEPMPRSALEDLRLAIDCLPQRTRIAMLEGIANNEIIVGAYTDRVGGVCPMLAAHRCGGRTNFISFARAWDRFAKVRHPRKATEREVDILQTQLEASLMAEERTGFDGAIADHQALTRERKAREARDSGSDWRWLRRPKRSEIEAAREVVDRELV